MLVSVRGAVGWISPRESGGCQRGCQAFYLATILEVFRSITLAEALVDTSGHRASGHPFSYTWLQSDSPYTIRLLF